MSLWRTMVLRPLKRYGLAAGAVALAAGAAARGQLRILPGQFQQQQPPAAAGDDLTNREAAEGVFIPESSSAQERLALALRKERQKEWNQSAELYQEILTDPKYAAKVVPVEADADHRLYRSVEDLVMQRLARWPSEGLDVYRARYEAQASAQMNSIKGASTYSLHQVFSRYFVTDVGKSAGIQLMDQYLESGEFRAASDIGDRLLKWHPKIGSDLAGVLYRTALACHLSGDESGAKNALADLKKRDPRAKGTVRGAEVVLADSLATELSSPVPTTMGEGSADSYTTFGGDASRNHVPAISGTPGAHLYSVALSKFPYPSGPQSSGAEASYKQDVNAGITTGVMPVVDRGELFFQDGQRIYAVNLESGVPLSGWVQTNGAEHGGAFRFPSGGSALRNRQLTLTVTDRSVLAVMNTGEQSPQTRFGLPPTTDTRLICVDRNTGKQAWITAPSQLKQEALRSLQFTGSPLVTGDNVLVAATESKQAGFEDFYVVCFALDTGTVRWASNIASSSTLAGGGFPFGQAIASIPVESHLAFANGRVFVQTNRGAVAAVDAYTGAISWLNTYSRGATLANNGFNAVAQFQQGGSNTSPVKPWTCNPVIASQGLVFTLPAEGKNLLIYNAATGERFKQIDMDELGQRLKSDDIQPPTYDTLVGVSGDTLVLAGNKSVVAVNWRTYDAAHYNDETMLMWEEGYRTEIRGRPFLTRTQVYLPLQDRMFMVSLKNGYAERDYPQYPRNWGDDEGPGNIVVTSDHAIIAGAEHVDVYTDLAAAKAKLDREVAEAPGDPQPRLRYAEVTYAAGDYTTALAKLDDAISRAGGPNIAPGPVRDRIFNDALTFAQKLKTDETPEGRQRVEALFDRAAKVAYVPEQQVYYRNARAGFDQIKGDLATATERYQEILSQPRWRVVSLPDESAKAPRSADAVARDRIDALIRRDPTVYQKFQTEAAEALRTAQASDDPAKLLAVAQTYPNSTLAARAMLAAATAYEASGQARLARRVLLDMYFDRKDTGSDRARILEALARTDVNSGARLLALGVGDSSDPKLREPLKLPDGSEIAAGTAFSKASQQMRNVSVIAPPATLPSFSLPMPPALDASGHYPKPFKADSPVIANVNALPDPIAGFERRDRIVTWSAEPVSLNIYRAGETRPVTTSHEVTERPVRCAWQGDHLIVWGTRQLFLLDNGGRTLTWKSDIAKLPSLEPVTNDDASVEAGAVMNNNNVQNNQVVVNGNVVIRGRLVRVAGVRPPMGIPAVAAARPVATGPEQIDQVTPVGDRLIVSTTSGRVACFESADGRLAWQIRLSDRPVDRVLANDDFTVIHSESDVNIRLEVLDTFSGHVRGSKVFARMSNSYPQNVALSPDGILAYTLPDRICIKDLYTSWSQKMIETRLSPPATYLGMKGPDQLIIDRRQVLAVVNSSGADQNGQKFVHVYSLDTGEPVKVQVENQQIEQALSAGTKSQDVRMRVAGSRLFTIAADSCNSYDLKHPERRESIYGQELWLATQDQKIDVADAFIGKDFLVFVGYESEPLGAAPGVAILPPGIPPAPKPAPAADLQHKSAQIAAFGRYQTASGEGARLDYPLKIDDASGITDEWQAFDGGICYRTDDNTLHLLIGAK